MDIDELIEWAKTADDASDILKTQVTEAIEAGELETLNTLVTVLSTIAPDVGFVIGIVRQVEAQHGDVAGLGVFIAALDAMEEDAFITIEAAKFAFGMGNTAVGIDLGLRAAMLAPESLPIVNGFADMALKAGAVREVLQALGASLGRNGADTELLLRLTWTLRTSQNLHDGLTGEEAAGLLSDAANLPEVRDLIDQILPPEPEAEPEAEPEPEAAPVVHAPPETSVTVEPLAVAGDATTAAKEPEAPASPPVDADDIEAVHARIAAGRGSHDDFLAVYRQCEDDTTAALRTRLEVLDLALAFHPASGLLLAERARCWSELGFPEPALEDIKAARELDPGNIPLACLYADILCVAESAAAGVAFVERVLDEHPGDPRLTLKYAQVAYWDNDIQKAEATLRGAELESAQSEAADVLMVDILLARDAAGEAEAIILRQLEAKPSNLYHLRNIRAGMALTWPAIPDYVDPARVARVRASLEYVGLANITPDLLWEATRQFAALKKFDFARQLMRAALARPSAQYLSSTHFKAFTATLLSRQPWDARIPTDSRELSRELNTAGLGHLSTGGRFWARAAFAVARAIDPRNAASAFNAAFSALADGEEDAAAGHFAGLDRIYQNEMVHVAWPRRGQAIWPRCQFDLAARYDARLPEGKTWPRISVITPSYNQGSYIEETILSILNQEYPNLEYIVCDGLSKDETISVLESYRDRIDHLLIEKDNGQTDAINKGMRLATGDLVTWINSDDMLAPGALFELALAYLNSDSDIIYGMCMPHIDYTFTMSNLPAVRQETFTPQYLADIFNYWMKGYFFYQPEVIFTRRILDKIGGGLDETLYFTMDYDFWMKCAKAEAKVQEVYWPVALFRHHENQKTANLLDCMLEQAEVRDQLVTMTPPPERVARLQQRVETILNGRTAPRVGVITSRLGKIFSPDSSRDITSWFKERGMTVELSDSALALQTSPDLLIKLVHLQSDVDEINAFRERHPSVPVVGWFWDNHHHLFANYEVSEVLDIAIPGHAFASSYLRNTKALQMDGIPLCITQWSYDEARQLYDGDDSAERSNELYGGFVRYVFAEKRNALIEALIETGEKGVYFLEETQLQRYFGKSQADRFKEWAQYKASVCLPLRSDLSQRLFDALLTGQIPIVSPDIYDLEGVFTPEERESLPIITFEAYTPEAVRAAHAEAIRRFDEGGPEAAMRRHLFALERHTFPARINDIIVALQGLSRANGETVKEATA